MIRLFVAVWAVALLSVIGLAMTPDEILQRVEEQGLLGLGAGDFRGALSMVLYEPDEQPEEYRFRIWGREEEDGTVKTIILYAYPELVEGTVFLLHSPPDEDPRMWLMLPELGVVREWVGDRVEQEFVRGTGVTYEEIAHGFTYRDGYESELQGEDMLDGESCWRLLVRSLDGTGAEWASIMLWVHRQEFIVLRADFVDASGALARRITASQLEQDELGTVPRLLVVEDLLDGVRAEIRVEERAREEFPEEYFIPERLLDLDL